MICHGDGTGMPARDGWRTSIGHALHILSRSAIGESTAQDYRGDSLAGVLLAGRLIYRGKGGSDQREHALTLVMVHRGALLTSESPKTLSGNIYQSSGANLDAYAERGR